MTCLRARCASLLAAILSLLVACDQVQDLGSADADGSPVADGGKPRDGGRPDQAGQDAAQCTPQIDDKQEQSETALTSLGCGWLVAQPLTALNSGKLVAVEALLSSHEIEPDDKCYVAGGKVGTIKAEIFATAEAANDGSAALASATVPADQPLGTAEMVRFELAPPVEVSAGTTYFLVISYDSSRYLGKWFGILSESFLHQTYFYRTATESTWRSEAEHCDGAQYCLYLRFRSYVCPGAP